MIESKKVVVVDDDLKVTMMMERALIKRGFRVFSANEGKKALELVKNEKPDVLVTDILQPGLDGVSLCNLIKNDAIFGDIKVIIISGVYNETSFKTQMDCRADGFIEKPIDMNNLADLIVKKINKCFESKG
jgi:two-component system alkaline phosphatase synthesis response regulator PhoP